mgnify:CR=1 FL=1
MLIHEHVHHRVTIHTIPQVYMFRLLTFWILGRYQLSPSTYGAALKRRAMQCVVIGKGAEWRCGLTGELTPLRMLDPAADSEPHRKHLHNLDQFGKRPTFALRQDVTQNLKPVMARLTCSLTQIVGKCRELIYS